MFIFLDLEDQCWSFIVSETLFTEDTAFALYREARSKGMTPVMDLMVGSFYTFDFIILKIIFITSVPIH